MKLKNIFLLILCCLLILISCSVEPPDSPDETSGGDGLILSPGNLGKIILTDVTLSEFTINWISAVDSPAAFDQLTYTVVKSGSDNLDTPENALVNGTTVGTPIPGSSASGVNMSQVVSGISKTDPPSYYTIIVSEPDGSKAVYNTYVYAMPVLKNLSVVFDDYDSNTGKAGDFLFTKGNDTSTINAIFEAAFNDGNYRPFHPFGDTLLSHDGSFSRELVIHTAAGTDILSPIDGVVVQIEYQNEYEGVEDYEVFIAPVEGGEWQISTDHLGSVAVVLGQHVSAGDTIGKPGLEYSYSDGITDIGMSELLVVSPDFKCWCPLALFDDTLADEYKTKVGDLMQDWETYIDDYDSTHDPDHADDQYDSAMSDYCSGCAAEFYLP